MKKNIIINDFLNMIELFYRNFGGDWEISGFVKNDDQQQTIKKYLPILEKKGIVKIIDNVRFKIIDLPSNHKDLWNH